MTKEEKKEHAYDGESGHAAVYCGTYYKYNCGSLDGMWVDLETFYDAEDLVEFLTRLHADEKSPELMFQDYENFPRKFYSESLSMSELEDLYEYLNMDSHDREIVGEYWDEIDSDRDAQDILDALVYEGDANDYYDELADEMMTCNGCPDTIRPYFDYVMWRRDCSFDYYETSNYLFSAY